MRLTPDEITAIKACVARHFGAGATVRLFGSRVHDHLRGGDIDLQVIAESPERAHWHHESDFRRDLEDMIGERRVDILLLAPGEPFRPIDHIAFNEGVVL
ncbi:nucleotidyltransferase domain-containing protein [uncultured Enterovirga sp.]|uniref:nucleotidyltransferase domain-containing protein n=1 Tax=uncultured Enterovirga sp. TaxID=2026352 RepID=UPI0035CA4F74